MLFQGVFADFIRIRVAELRMERALQASVRSTLSAFDRSLLDYGLFGLTLSNESKQAIFEKVLKNSLNPDESGQAFRFVQVSTVAQPVLQSLYTLGNPRVFEHQVLESMKVVAPLEYTRKIIEPFVDLKKDIFGAKSYVEHADETERLIAEREQLLDRNWSEIQELNRWSRETDQRFNTLKNQINTLSARIGDVREETVRERITELRKEAFGSDGTPNPGVLRALDKVFPII